MFQACTTGPTTLLGIQNIYIFQFSVSASLVFFLGVEKPLEIPSSFFFFSSHFIYFKLVFNWGGVRELLYSVCFCYTTAQISHNYTHNTSHLSLHHLLPSPPQAITECPAGSLFCHSCMQLLSSLLVLYTVCYEVVFYIIIFKDSMQSLYFCV